MALLLFLDVCRSSSFPLPFTGSLVLSLLLVDLPSWICPSDYLSVYVFPGKLAVSGKRVSWSLQSVLELEGDAGREEGRNSTCDRWVNKKTLTVSFFFLVSHVLLRTSVSRSQSLSAPFAAKCGIVKIKCPKCPHLYPGSCIFDVYNCVAFPSYSIKCSDLQPVENFAL